MSRGGSFQASLSPLSEDLESDRTSASQGSVSVPRSLLFRPPPLAGRHSLGTSHSLRPARQRRQAPSYLRPVIAGKSSLGAEGFASGGPSQPELFGGGEARHG